MTNKEVIEKWKRVLDGNPSDKSKELLEVTIQALEKQEPKKVVIKWLDNIIFKAYCQTCGDELLDHRNEVCKCKQIVDWRD